MLHSPLDQITEEDVRLFLSKTRLPETATLDYKRDYDLGSSKGRSGFLSDICAFANNGGGHILVGVDEERDESDQKTGFPVASPTGAKTFDKSVAEDVVHASIDPRLGSLVRIQTIPGSWTDGPFHVIRVERTWTPPHCVRASEKRTFYRRSGTKSEPMDMNQIREAFAAAASLEERIHAFRRSRMERVFRGETTFPLADAKGRAIVHVVPLGGFASGTHLPLEDVPLLQPSSGAGGFWSPVPNFDGKIAYAGKPKATSYIQVFRHGAVETVNTDLLYEDGNNQGLRARTIEANVLRTLEQAQVFFDSQPGLEPPVVVMLTVVGVRGAFILPHDPSYSGSSLHAIELDQMEFPEVRLASLRDGLETSMRPLFDWLWQTGGWPKSPSYDMQGKYKSS